MLYIYIYIYILYIYIYTYYIYIYIASQYKHYPHRNTKIQIESKRKFLDQETLTLYGLNQELN